MSWAGYVLHRPLLLPSWLSDSGCGVQGSIVDAVERCRSKPESPNSISPGTALHRSFAAAAELRSPPSLNVPQTGDEMDPIRITRVSMIVRGET
jgi:hypothetical protein